MKRLFFILISIMLLFHFAVPSAAETFPMPNLSTLMQDVKSAIRQAEARYESGNVSGAADLARKILAKYPNNADAQAILDKCIATEKADYETAINSLDVDRLSAFLQKYPASSYKSDIERYIDDVPLWNIARKENSVDSYNKYLMASSHLLFKQDADDAIQEITVKQAFDAAMATNTIKGYENFRSSYPDSKYDKDASNKIARLLADNFTSKSTYADKNNALAYAKNEMTRDYVNNKFNKATSVSNSRSSSSSNTSYGSSTSTRERSDERYSAPASSQGLNESIVNFGIQGFIDFAGISSLSPTYLGGVGLEMRIGKVSNAINLLVGAKLGWASFEYSYYEKQYYGSKTWEYDYVDVENSGKTTNLLIPIILNWNFVKSDWACWYLGLGYQYGVPIDASTSSGQQSHAIIIQNGIGFRHFDARIYYTNYPTSLFVDTTAKSPQFGLSMTYYF